MALPEEGGITERAEAPSGAKSQRKSELSLFACAETSVFFPHISGLLVSDFQIQIGTYTISPQFSGVRTWTERHYRLSWFSGLQTGDCATPRSP